MSPRRIFLYVQHLLGIGHFRRAATLARALASEGMQVTFATGGLPVPESMPAGVEVVQLPAATAADLGFRTLIDEHGNAIDDAWRNARREALLQAWRKSQAHALIVELFPFGRRQMRFELLPLLEEASRGQPRPLIVSSVRDVLAHSSPERQDEMLAMFERYFDSVLVHGDPRLIPFERTFRHALRLGERMHYTGFIVDRSPLAGGEAGRDEVLVSVGGGAVGAPLLQAALEARPLTIVRDRTWRLIAGEQLPGASFAELRERAAGDRNVIVERSRADFRTLLQNCAVSVSQAGYNTLMEILDCGARSVVVPFSTGKETEQAMRAGALAALGRVHVLEEARLSGEALAAAIDRAVQGAKPVPAQFDLDGARNSAEWLARRTAGFHW
ncbi:MAG TPA: glycosyltransferase [Burkholderiales bacterium]|nr:glycosyltransferase [Burkholderiales bacterium]